MDVTRSGKRLVSANSGLSLRHSLNRGAKPRRFMRPTLPFVGRQGDFGIFWTKRILPCQRPQERLREDACEALPYLNVPAEPAGIWDVTDPGGGPLPIAQRGLVSRRR